MDKTNPSCYTGIVELLAIDASINLLTLQYDFYNGGNGELIHIIHPCIQLGLKCDTKDEHRTPQVFSGHHLNGYLFTKDNFVADAGQVFRNFCFEQPQTSDLPT